MSILSVTQNVADVVGLPRPSQVIGSTNQLARQMLGLAKRELQTLHVRNWPVLERLYSFNTVVDQAEYGFPIDCKNIIANTAYADNVYKRLRGGKTPGEWARLRAGIGIPDGCYRFRLSGFPLKIVLFPTPTAVENITLEYKTINTVVDNANVQKESFTADTDTSLVPEELLELGLTWRIRHAKGLEYAEDYNNYTSRVAELFSQALALDDIPVSAYVPEECSGVLDPYCPTTGFGA